MMIEPWDQARQGYRTQGYALVERLFPPMLLQVFHGKMQADLNFRQSERYLSSSPLLTKAAIEVYSRQYAPMATFHWGLTPAISEIARCELMPTYAYFRVYQQGDVCLVHSDRRACEHSLSLTVELSDDRPWALSIGSRRIEAAEPEEKDFAGDDYTPIPMTAGDAVIYRGVEHRHGRIEPNPNRWSAHLFLHWVDVNGPYAEHAFDRVMRERHGKRP